MKCRIYDTDCINPRFCNERDACCAGDPECRPECSYCYSEIDPNTCHCGSATEDHTAYSGHNPVPMGCICHLLNEPGAMDKETLIRIAQRKHDDAMATAKAHLLAAARWIKELRLPEEKIPELDLLARSLTDASVYVSEVSTLDFS